MIQGLSSSQANIDLAKYGYNLLPDKTKIGSLSLIFNQFRNLLTLVLVAAAGISLFVGDRLDFFLILIILLLNAILGFWQEYKASKELQVLKKLEVSTSRVIRDGKEVEITSFELVPRDLVLLEAGDKIPADGVVVESYSLSVNESALTGESLPIIKSTNQNDNQLFFGTEVVSGRAKMRVILTGQKTRFGEIALTLSQVEEEATPLEVSLNRLAKNVGIIALFISVGVFAIGLIRQQPIFEIFFSSVALMVAVVPEGLPAIITVLLAFGMRKMYQRKTVVRKMSAIESLGATNVICIDKTGTLTKNQMRVKEVILADDKYKTLAIRASVICSSANLVTKEDHGSFDILGDTTEGALLLWANENGVDIVALRGTGRIVEEVPFDLKRRMMSVAWEEEGSFSLYSKGAPEVVLPLCNLSKNKLEQLNKDYRRLASKGLRVLVIAQKTDSGKNIEEKDLQCLALVGIADAPREEAEKAIAKARKAGIEVIMVTGDNELTAKAIAEEVGLLREGDEILLGSQLAELTDEELANKIEKVRIFARVVPEDKLRIVSAYQGIGKVVAVTGDGVNDALALKQAHIGVAMGMTGTDVAKEAADIVILDDNLSTIISAVEEGRVIYSNILKVVKFLLTGNLSEVLLVVTAVLIGYPTPLLPVQLLWINFVTDGLPALSLTADRASKNLMNVSPRSQSEPILSISNLKYISFYGTLIALINLLIFLGLFHSLGLQVARNIVFTTTVISQMIFIFILRKHHSITSNKYLFYSVVLILLVQFLILVYPPLQMAFRIN